MTEPAFWRSTPRKIAALLEVHVRVNDPDEIEKANKEAEKSKAVKATPADVLGWNQR